MDVKQSNNAENKRYPSQISFQENAPLYKTESIFKQILLPS